MSDAAAACFQAVLEAAQEQPPSSLIRLDMALDPDLRSMLHICDNMLKAKGHDYTQGSPNRLQNFDAAAVRLGLRPEQVLAVYMNKHWSALETFFQKGRVESEPIEGRIADLINYLLLLSKMVARSNKTE